MRRVSLIAVLSLFLLASLVGTAAAQEDATDLSECDPQSDQYRDCVVSNTSVEDVYGWLNQTPDALSDHQQYALSLYTTENEFKSEFQNETLERATDWKEWANGRIEQPEWFGTPLNETSTPTDEPTTASEQDADAPDTKWRQIRDGQWVVSKPTFYQENGTGKIEVHSEFDGRIAIVDNGDCSNGETVCSPDVTNAQVAAGETTTIWFDATPQSGTIANGHQAVTLNSLTDAQGMYKLRVMLLGSEQKPFFTKPKWVYVTAVAVTSTFVLVGFALLVYAYFRVRDKTIEVHGWEFVRENL